jgi:hypothetical protein
MIYLLYKTTNLINGKTYIGIHQTKNINDGYLGSGLYFLRAVKKYGKENFKREILEFCSSFDELLEKKKFMLAKTGLKIKVITMLKLVVRVVVFYQMNQKIKYQKH